MVGKAALQAPTVGGLKARPVRGVMQEIGNNGAVLKGREPANKGVYICFKVCLLFVFLRLINFIFTLFWIMVASFKFHPPFSFHIFLRIA